MATAMAMAMAMAMKLAVAMALDMAMAMQGSTFELLLQPCAAGTRRRRRRSGRAPSWGSQCRSLVHWGAGRSPAWVRLGLRKGLIKVY